MVPSRTKLTLDRAELVLDGAGVEAAPGAILRRGLEVLAAGGPESIGSPEEAQIIEHPGMALIPALGNSHAHLDLSALAPAPYAGDFPAWLGRIREFRRAAMGDRAADSMSQGIELSFAGGVCLVGDIAGAPQGAAAAAQMEAGGLSGVSFIEVFGAGRGELTAMETLRGLGPRQDPVLPESRVRIGIQPHAPYSTTRAVVHRALSLRRPFSIHLSETSDEVEYMKSGRGPLREMLASFGVASELGIDDRSQSTSAGAHPVDWFCDLLEEYERSGGAGGTRQARLAVHLNELESTHAARLVQLGVSAVYCPRATAYFGRCGMPWRHLRARGVRICLGTDGLLSLDTPDRISTLDELRFLWRHDAADLTETLPMATTEVARALGFDPAPYTLAPGVKPGLLSIECGRDGWRGILNGDAPPRWLAGPDRTERPQ